MIYFIFPVLVNAATSLDTKNQRPVVGTTIEVTLRVDYGTDVQISEAHYYVTYDPSLLEFESLNWTQSRGTYSNSNGVVSIDKLADGEAWGYGTPIVLKFKSIQAGASNIQITEKSPGKYSDGSILAQSYSGITINAVEPSSATRIGKLYVEGYSVSPTFNVDNYKYTLTVPSTTTKVNVVASKGEKNQTITGDGQRVLLYGDNRVRVTVTAQNGDSSTYEIMIHRTDDRSGDVSLKSLNIGDKSIEIEENKTTYETTVSRSVESIFLSAQTTDSKATLVGTGQKKLNIGENIFELRVSSKNTLRLISVTEQSFYEAMKVARHGNRVGDIGAAIEGFVISNGFSVVKDYTGHGVGAELHEDPEVPNYGRAGRGTRLYSGMTLAVEPMVNQGGEAVKVLKDGWCVVTLDGSLSAHYENSIAITESDPILLTDVES